MMLTAAFLSFRRPPVKHLTAPVFCTIATFASLAAPAGAAPAPLIPFADLELQAKSRTAAPARVPLAPATADIFRGLDGFEPAGGGRVPNYLRALASVKPATAKPFAHLLK